MLSMSIICCQICHLKEIKDKTAKISVNFIFNGKMNKFAFYNKMCILKISCSQICILNIKCYISRQKLRKQPVLEYLSNKLILNAVNYVYNGINRFYNLIHYSEILQTL